MTFAGSLLDIERAIAKDRGPLELFAALQREDAPGRWDLLISAPWFDPNSLDDLTFVADRLKAGLSAEDYQKISRIVALQKGEPALETLLGLAKVEHSQHELANVGIGQVPVAKGIIITSMPRAVEKRRRSKNQARPTG